MKKLIGENEPKLGTGFTVPDNYFEDFALKLMQNLPKEQPKTISIFSENKKWMYAAAAVLLLSLSLPIYNHFNSNSTEIDTTTLENYLTYNTNISDEELVYLLNDKDIQKMNLAYGIDDTTIENELSENNNLEQYLIN